MHFDLSIITNNLPLFLEGAGMTLVISLIAFAAGMVIGTIAAVLSLQSFPPLRWITAAYVLVMRGIPFIALLFLIHFGLPTLGLRPPPFVDGTASLSLYAGAYYAEIIRACVKALPKGQWESARTIGLSRLAAARHIILPQILAPMIAPVVNCTITMIKESAVISSITVSELTFAGLVVQGNTFSPFEVFVAVALLYWLITAVFSVPARYAERHLSRHGGQRMTPLVGRYLVLTGARSR